MNLAKPSALFRVTYSAMHHTLSTLAPDSLRAGSQAKGLGADKTKGAETLLAYLFYSPSIRFPVELGSYCERESILLQFLDLPLDTV